jgi:hypothetical protein
VVEAVEDVCKPVSTHRLKIEVETDHPYNDKEFLISICNISHSRRLERPELLSAQKFIGGRSCRTVREKSAAAHSVVQKMLPALR